MTRSPDHPIDPKETTVADGQISQQEQLRHRTKQFALRIIRLFRHLPRSTEAQVLGKQLLRSGTSVGANYRAAGRSRSKAEFVSKIGIVVEEADETVFWIECLIESGIVKEELLKDLLVEANELLAIFAASHRTARPR
jgi:four helix bundle protein